VGGGRRRSRGPAAAGAARRRQRWHRRPAARTGASALDAWPGASAAIGAGATPLRVRRRAHRLEQDVGAVTPATHLGRTCSTGRGGYFTDDSVEVPAAASIHLAHAGEPDDVGVPGGHRQRGGRQPGPLHGTGHDRPQRPVSAVADGGRRGDTAAPEAPAAVAMPVMAAIPLTGSTVDAAPWLLRGCGERRLAAYPEPPGPRLSTPRARGSAPAPTRLTTGSSQPVAKAIAGSSRAVADVAAEHRVSWRTTHRAFTAAAARWLDRRPRHARRAAARRRAGLLRVLRARRLHCDGAAIAIPLDWHQWWRAERPSTALHVRHGAPDATSGRCSTDVSRSTSTSPEPAARPSHLCALAHQPRDGWLCSSSTRETNMVPVGREMEFGPVEPARRRLALPPSNSGRGG
jgi:hypothetical protein